MVKGKRYRYKLSSGLLSKEEFTCIQITPCGNALMYNETEKYEFLIHKDSFLQYTEPKTTQKTWFVRLEEDGPQLYDLNPLNYDGYLTLTVNSTGTVLPTYKKR